jgi:aldehyde:ferredoxin oxidoreductase
MPGYTGKVLIVDLSSGEIREEHPPENLYRQFIGGVGLGVRLIYEYQTGKVDPLGEPNILGFFPGLLSSSWKTALKSIPIVWL